jgi:hypothetical protein
MLKITYRDRLFLAIAVPAAFLAACIFFVHLPRHHRLAQMEFRLATLGDADTLRAQLATLEHLRDDAAADLRATRADEAARRAAEATSPDALPTAPSARLQRLVALFGAPPPLRIASTTLLATGPDISPSAPLVTEALGGESPALWRFTLLTDYPTLLGVLRTLSARAHPVVVERLSLDPVPPRAATATRTWHLEICL